MIKFFEVLCSNFNQCYSNFNQWWPLPCSKYRLNNIPLTSIIQIPLMCFRTRLLWQRSFLSRSMINLCVVNGHASTRKIIGCPVGRGSNTQNHVFLDAAQGLHPADVWSLPTKFQVIWVTRNWYRHTPPHPNSV